MKKKLCSLALAFCITTCTITTPVQAAKKVYYVPGSSYAYHTSRSCRTLSRSKHVKKITIKKAKALKLKKCKVCS